MTSTIGTFNKFSINWLTFVTKIFQNVLEMLCSRSHYNGRLSLLRHRNVVYQNHVEQHKTFFWRSLHDLNIIYAYRRGFSMRPSKTLYELMVRTMKCNVSSIRTDKICIFSGRFSSIDTYNNYLTKSHTNAFDALAQYCLAISCSWYMGKL